MLHILLLILKILLFAILALLGLALLLILVILFAPIKYNFSVVKNDNIRADAKIKFLIVAIKVYFDKNENKMDIIPSIIGIKLKKINKKDNGSGELSDKNFHGQEEIQTSENTEENLEEDIQEDIQKDIQEDYISLEDNSNNDIFQEEDKFQNDIKEDTGSTSKSFTTNEKMDFHSRISVLERKLVRLKKFWNFDCTVKTRKYLKKYIISVIKHISPRKIKGYIRYGFGDPCNTGQVTGYLSLLPCVYQDDFNLYPDFYNKILECDVYAKGRIRIGYLVRIIFNINIWRTVKLFKKLSNRLKTVK